MDFIMGLVSKKHQAYNPYSFQTIARESRPDLSLSFIEQGPLSMASSTHQVEAGVWRLGPNQGCFLEVRFEERPLRIEIRQDKWGTKPCFYFEDHEKFIFSSDFYTLTKFMGESGVMDYDGIAEYLKTGLLFGGQTFFKNIKMLAFKHVLFFDRKNVKTKEQQYPQSDLENLSKKEKVERCLDCFEQSVMDWKNYAPAEKLTNLYARELVGREIVPALNFYFDSFSFVTDKEIQLLLNHQNTQSKMLADRSFEFCLEALFHSFFTDIYERGAFDDWSTPHQFIQKKASPFLNSKLIDHLVALGADDIELPLHAAVESLAVEAEGPKRAQEKEFSQVEIEKQNAQIGIFCPQEFRELLTQNKNPVLLKRCLKLNHWMDTLALVAKKENWLDRLWAFTRSYF